MDAADALRTLGLDGSPSWDAVRAAHRASIRIAHPDAGGDPGTAARVNEAYDALHRLTEGGTRAVPSSAPVPPTPPVGVSADPPHHVDRVEPAAEVLMRLADAARDIGEVVAVDPTAGRLEVVVGDGSGIGQLAVTVAEASDGTDDVPVAFTLEPLGTTPAPPIHDVVADLMGRVRRR